MKLYHYISKPNTALNEGILSFANNPNADLRYETDNKHKLYVSRGAGQWGPQMRFLAPSEITVINLININ